MKKSIRFSFIGLLITILSFQNIQAQTSVSQAQAVFVYNFTRLIEWPADFKSGDFVVCVYGSSEIFNDVKNFCSGKMVGTQKIIVTKNSDIDGIGKCHIVFVANSKTKQIGAISAKTNSNKTLIISEKNGALDEGSAINFVIIEDKLKFELKAGNATKIGLKINSTLENMAAAKY